MIVANNGSYPWRATPIGVELKRLLASSEAASTSEEARHLRDRLTRQVIEEQVRAGCDLVTDGLVRRDDPVGHLMSGLQGIEMGEVRDGYPAGGGRYRVPIVRSEVSWKAPILAEDYLFAAAGAGPAIKPVLTGPFTLATLADDHAYGDPMALSMVLATAINQELRAIQAAGATWIQIDEPALLHRKEEFPIFTRVWEVLGRGLEATLVLHLEGGSLDGLMSGMARLKRLGCLSLDCVTHPGNLTHLADPALPETIRLGLGLISGASERVETAQELAALVHETPGLPVGDRLVLGTGTDLGGLPPAVAAAKIGALAGARALL